MKAEVRIDSNDAGQRADRYLRRYLASLSLARIQSLFRKKEIKVNRKAIARNHLLAAGDTLEIFGLTESQVAQAGKPLTTWEGSEGPSEDEMGLVLAPVSATQLPFAIVFEDDELLVVNKPAGMAVHPGTGITPGRSLIEWAQRYLGRNSDSLFQPSLVHRLDKETSGLLLIAKTGGTLRRLTGALRAGELRKEYLALLIGQPPTPQGTLRDTLERQDTRHGGAKSLVTEEEGQLAITHYETLGSHRGYTLVRAIIETGRMHQIRAQFSHAGCPLAGDRRYASAEGNEAARRELGLRRLFLHAEKLTWTGPTHSQTFLAPLPEPLQAVLNQLT
jgi:23S rRNA pseudouridine955/2504/2580 synthase